LTEKISPNKAPPILEIIVHSKIIFEPIKLAAEKIKQE